MSGSSESVDLAVDAIDFTDQFWLFIETNMGCTVPKYLKHILRIRGYDNAASIGTLNLSDIQQLQEFIRVKLEKTPTQNVDREKFYPQYHDDSDPFEILPGHIKLLEKVVSYVNSMSEQHGAGYFNPRAEKNTRKRGSTQVPIRRNYVRGEMPINYI